MRSIITWTIILGAALQSFGQVTIIYPSGTTPSSPRTICRDTIKLVGSNPQTGKGGCWSTFSPSRVTYLSDKKNDTVMVALSGSGPIQLYWAVGTNPADSAYAFAYLDNQSPSKAVLPIDRISCSNSINIVANNPDFGNGKWRVISGTGSISSGDDPSAQILNMSLFDNEFEWSISTPRCSTITKKAIIKVSNYTPSKAFLGANNPVCSDSSFLQANTPTSPTIGEWRGPSYVTIVNPNNPNSKVLKLRTGPNYFVWRTYVNSQYCVDSAKMTLISSQRQTALIFGKPLVDTALCSDKIQLIGSKSSPNTGQWSFIKGSGVFSNGGTQDTTLVTSLGIGIDSIKWTINNSICGTSVATVRIRNNTTTKPLVTKDSCFLSPFTSPLTLRLKNSLKAGETGAWAAVKAPVSFGSLGLSNNTTTHVATFTPQGAGIYRFAYNVSNTASCSNRDLTTYFLITKAVAPNDTCVFLNTGSSTINVSLQPKFIPKRSQGEWGEWKIMSGTATLVPVNDSVVVFSAGLGNYSLSYSIRNDSCSTCSTVCSNMDVFNVTVSSKAKIATYPTCFLPNSLSLSANALGSGETGKWKSSNGIFLPDSTKISTMATNIGIGKSNVVWTVSRGLCMSMDTAKLTRVTTPNAGKDTCFASGISNLNYVVTGNAVAAGESGQWLKGFNSALLNFTPNNSQGTVGDSKNNGVYYLRWRILALGCPVFEDTVRIGIVTAPRIPLDTVTYLPLATPAPTIVGNQGVINSEEKVQWFNPSGVPYPVGNNVLTLPAIAAGKYNFRYTIKDSLGYCGFSSTTAVTYLTRSSIKKSKLDTCLKSVNSFNLEAGLPATGETGTWMVDTIKYKNVVVQQQLGAPQKVTLYLNGQIHNKYVVYWKVTSGKFSFLDSIIVTNLTKPIASTNLCAKDTFLMLGPPLGFPARQTYERAFWVKKPLGNPSKFLTDSLATAIYGLLPGQVSLATVIVDNTSACTDTSVYAILSTVTKAKAFNSPYRCITDTFSTLSANIPVIGERGKWTYKSSSNNVVPVIVSPNSPSSVVHHLGKRATRFIWKISNILDSSCFSSDSTNTRLVVSTKAAVGYTDTCIVGSRSVKLRATKAQPYEKQAWLRIPSTDTLSRNEKFVYANAPLGVNTFSWVIYDTTYKSCVTTATQKASVLIRPKLLKATTCLVLAGSTVTDTLVSANESGSSDIKYLWKKDPVFLSDSIQLLSSSPTQFSYRAVFSQPGRRSLKWRDSISTSCFADTSLLVTVISNAQATLSSTCVVQPSVMDTLKAIPMISATEFGLWTVRGPATITNPTSARALAQFTQRGKAEFVWKVKDGSCQDSTTLSATSLSKASITGDSCLFYSDKLSNNILTGSLVKSIEKGSWMNTSLRYDSLLANTFKVSGFVKGENQVSWKVTSLLDPTCVDSAKVVYRTLSGNGFASSYTVFPCSKDVTIPVNNRPYSNAETVTWRLSPSGYKISNLSKPDSISLKGLSNDTTYRLYRSVVHNNSCSLVDSFFIRNRQLDTVWALPQKLESDLAPNTYFTCSNSFEIWTNNPVSDISTGQGTWLKPYQQAPGNNSLSVDHNTSSSALQRYFVTGMQVLGAYNITWQVQNETCPPRKVTLQIERRQDLNDIQQIFSRNVCTNEYRFDSVQIYKEADSVKWEAITSATFIDSLYVNDGKNVTFKNLQPENNQATYTVYKSGCPKETSINIYRTDSLYSVNIEGEKLDYCEKGTDTLRASYDLAKPDPKYFKMYWTNSLALQDSTNLTHIASSLPKQEWVKVNVLPTNVSKKYYFYSKNGKCPIRIDSVVISNFSRPLNIDAGIKGVDSLAGIDLQTVCGSTARLNGRKPDYAKGKWTIDDSDAIFGSDTASVTTIGNLKARSQLYNLTWDVVNGACAAKTATQFRVADTLSEPIVISDSIRKLCNPDSWTLSALQPDYGKGSWYQGTALLSADTNYLYQVPANVNLEYFTYSWVISNDYCRKSDTVKVDYARAPSIAEAGDLQSIVTDKTTLEAIKPEVGVGTWEVLRGSGIISDSKDPKSQVTNLNFGENKFKWTITNGQQCVINTDEVTIVFKDFSIPQGFSPNGDAKNDKFEVKGLESYTGTELMVYNRWGQEVYASNNYQNSWDGDGLNDDTYYYVMTLINGRKYTGYVVLKRN